MGVYFLPLFGALLADIFWGKYKTIMALSLVYCLGHLVLALDHTRLGLAWGLALIAIGAGGIKPCVSAHLGDQFSRGNSHLLDKAYAWFYFSINVGAVLSMLAGEWLLRQFGPHVAFGVPGGLMLLATAVFYYGRRTYRSIPPSGWPLFKQMLLAGQTRRAILRLLPIFALVAVFWSLYDQTGSSWVLQAQSDLMDKRIRFFGWSVVLLPSQIQAVNSLLILLFVPLFSAVLYPMASRYGIASTALRKIGLGMFLAALSFAIIAALELRIFNGQSASVSGQLWAYVAMTAAEVLISMTCLEFAYTQAPNPAKSLVMGLYFLSLSAGNFLAVEVNRVIQADFPLQTEILSGEGLPQPAAGMSPAFNPIRFRAA
jgi:POT family proton-dependent oligopeptide transporter